MHPAYSVILFTTASGAGYGLLFWLGLRAVAGLPPSGGWAALVPLGIGVVLVTVGLLSSTFHLGRPERAIRAFSQWRTSWLSREGVAAVSTYVPAGLVGLVWLTGTARAAAAPLGLALAAGAVATVYCTGMIYASLRTVPQWHSPLVPALYLSLSAGSGAVLMAAVDAAAGRDIAPMAAVGAVALVAALGLKLAYWRRIDGAPPGYDLAMALGIPGASDIRPLDPPHTRPNFVMREMGYAVARRHARTLRFYGVVLLFAVPLAALAAALLWPAGALPLLGLALVSLACGLFVERWLFFAEARHVSMIYYDGAPVRS